jgi:hypothetical protein
MRSKLLYVFFTVCAAIATTKSMAQCTVFPFDYSSTGRTTAQITEAQKMFTENCKIKTNSCCGMEAIEADDISIDVAAQDLDDLMNRVGGLTYKDCKALYIYYGLNKDRELVFIFNPVRMIYKDVDNFRVTFYPQENLNYYTYQPKADSGKRWHNIGNYTYNFMTRFRRKMMVIKDEKDFRHISVNNAASISDPSALFFVCSQLEQFREDNNNPEYITFSFGLENVPMNKNLDDRYVQTVMMYPKGMLEAKDNEKSGIGALNGALCPPGLPPAQTVTVKMALK